MKQVIIAESILHAVGKSLTLFGRGGITVHRAHTSEEIIALHRANKVDLIISDVGLPHMDGERFCATIRDDAGLRAVSLIMISPAEGSEAAACRKAGANAVIMRPIDPTELFSRISELLIIPQRQHMRAFLRVSVTHGGGKTSFLGVSHNVSISGMLLETGHELKKDDKLCCFLSVGGREIAAETQVMRTARTAEGRFQCGVKFVNLDTKSLVIIEQFVSGHIKH